MLFMFLVSPIKSPDIGGGYYFRTRDYRLASTSQSFCFWCANIFKTNETTPARRRSLYETGGRVYEKAMLSLSHFFCQEVEGLRGGFDGDFLGGAEEVDAEGELLLAGLDAQHIVGVYHIRASQQHEATADVGRQLLVHHPGNLGPLIGECVDDIAVGEVDVAVVAVGLYEQNAVGRQIEHFALVPDGQYFLHSLFFLLAKVRKSV